MTQQSGPFELSVSFEGSSFSANGDAALVLQAYADFKELLVSRVGRGASPASRGKSADGRAGAAHVGEVKSPTSLPLKPYLARLNLTSNKQKATAIIAWSAESGDKADLALSDIEQLWKRTPWRAPSNLPRDVRAAETEGWLDRDGKTGSPEATYSINGYGEGIVAGWVAGPSA
jgi:hypothetical protein